MNSSACATAAPILYFQAIGASETSGQTRSMESRLARQCAFGCVAAVFGLMLGGAAAVPSGTTDSSTKPLGAIAGTTGARLNGGSALSGAAVHSGDIVETDTRGALHLRLGSAQVFLSKSSSASLEQRGSLASLMLVKGSATFSLPNPLGFQLETPAGILRGSGTHATAGQVVVVSADQMVVTASKGNLILDADGQLYEIRQGQSYRIVVEQDHRASISTLNRRAPGEVRGHRKLFFFLLGNAGTFAAILPF